jgi:hypothetical protein
LDWLSLLVTIHVVNDRGSPEAANKFLVRGLRWHPRRDLARPQKAGLVLVCGRSPPSRGRLPMSFVRSFALRFNNETNAIDARPGSVA